MLGVAYHTSSFSLEEISLVKHSSKLQRAYVLHRGHDCIYTEKGWQPLTSFPQNCGDDLHIAMFPFYRFLESRIRLDSRTTIQKQIKSLDTFQFGGTALMTVSFSDVQVCGIYIQKQSTYLLKANGQCPGVV